MGLLRLVGMLGCTLLVGLAAHPVARSAEISRPALLVASPERGQGNTVLFVRPLAGGEHLGFIINRPTEVTLSKLFPEHAPSQKVTQPVLFGGPLYLDSLFAVVHQNESPGGHSIALADDLFLVVDVDLIDGVIERDGDGARFLVGLVVWPPGELERQVQANTWWVLEPDTDLVFRMSTDGLWEELVRRGRGAT